MGIYECLDGEEDAVRDQKLATLEVFDRGMKAFLKGDMAAAVSAFAEVVARHPEDAAAGRFLERAQKLAESGVPEGWTGVEAMEEK